MKIGGLEVLRREAAGEEGEMESLRRHTEEKCTERYIAGSGKAACRRCR